ncbi:hypothetical protein T439DRAFT_326887 [Meredithblackwellia eburnea MCA 4105]
MEVSREPVSEQPRWEPDLTRPSLPPELALAVVRYAGAIPDEHDSVEAMPDYETLTSCALVNKSWSSIAQRVMWTYIVIRRDKSPATVGTRINDGVFDYLAAEYDGPRRIISGKDVMSNPEHWKRDETACELAKINLGKWLAGSWERRRRMGPDYWEPTTDTFVIDDRERDGSNSIVNRIGIRAALKELYPGTPRRLAFLNLPGSFSTGSASIFNSESLAEVKSLHVSAAPTKESSNQVHIYDEPFNFKSLTSLNLCGLKQGPYGISGAGYLLTAVLGTIKHLKIDFGGFYQPHPQTLQPDPNLIVLLSRLESLDVGDMSTVDLTHLLPHLGHCAALTYLRFKVSLTHFVQTVNFLTAHLPDPSVLSHLTMVFKLPTTRDDLGFLLRGLRPPARRYVDASVFQALRTIANGPSLANLRVWRFEGMGEIGQFSPDGTVGMFRLFKLECEGRGTVVEEGEEKESIW